MPSRRASEPSGRMTVRLDAHVLAIEPAIPSSLAVVCGPVPWATDDPLLGLCPHGLSDAMSRLRERQKSQPAPVLSTEWIEVRYETADRLEVDVLIAPAAGEA